MNIATYVSGLTLLSDQVSKREVEIILRELTKTLDRHVVGDVVEFGCYEGTTSVHLAYFLQATDKHLYLYDSFEGLPDKTAFDESPAGMQFKTGELKAAKKQLIKNLRQMNTPMPRIKKGWFSELTQTDIPVVISYAFLDGDYYESIMDPLRLIWPRLSPGAIVVVDDYANEALPGAAKAVDQWLQTHTAALSVEASLGIIKLPE
ncbi:hypothetical protein A2707_03650 [Candidatus Saccharibacteria bacterium RIFCSPHIGHO2_01_FULL_45_15]|nr:MAG: hypothetical protein A2707_03650 [Candidatus Saccharibacteria bacterium RIFCSPHIGHO2_01_FULL_45_15]OGL28674.1 MAG: hypothetical protein A3C39_05470 [Candidatus Saccharibacteria bacterium RIFCSPHIGHO2_02_FULL_46_12]OGL31477.1 MAG: hypothetical protein A3E76_03655 [Candidatus Saccharibacteria bacterium RIFCSPHIGHO2_12_FULL_44_22]